MIQGVLGERFSCADKRGSEKFSYLGVLFFILALFHLVLAILLYQSMKKVTVIEGTRRSTLQHTRHSRH